MSSKVPLKCTFYCTEWPLVSEGSMFCSYVHSNPKLHGVSFSLAAVITGAICSAFFGELMRAAGIQDMFIVLFWHSLSPVSMLLKVPDHTTGRWQPLDRLREPVLIYRL